MGRKRKSEVNGEMPKEKEAEPEEDTNRLQVMEERPEFADPSAEKVTPLPNEQLNYPTKSSVARKKTKNDIVAVRRSGRIQGAVVNVQTQEIQPVFEEIIFSGSEKGDEQANMEQELPNPAPREESVEEKLDYLLQVVGAQGKDLEKLMSKLDNQAPSPAKDSNSDSPNMGYKSLYIDSQKKIEKLSKENEELSLKLEVAVTKLERTEGFEKERNEISQELKAALAKLEGYEKGMRVSAELMQILKDFTMASNLARATEEVNVIRNALSGQDAADAQEPTTAAKRRK